MDDESTPLTDKFLEGLQNPSPGTCYNMLPPWSLGEVVQWAKDMEKNFRRMHTAVHQAKNEFCVVTGRLAKLRAYATHHDHCNISCNRAVGHSDSSVAGCSCGLDDLLEEIKKL